MRKMQTFEAYVDQYETITVYLKKTFYNGESSTFRLKDENSASVELEILEKVEDGDYVKYLLKSPSLTFGGEYRVADDHNLQTPLQFGYVVRTKEFDEEFYYAGDDLGTTYTKEATIFKVWAPIANRVKVDIALNDGYQTYDLTREANGVWTVTVSGDLELASYVYLVKVNGKWNEATDPYAIASTPNHKRTVVVDPEKINIESNRNMAPRVESYTDAIIYEMHVRDFSVHENSGIQNVGKFLGVVEEGTRTSRGTLTGLDYLVDLGVTHIQLLPTYDFGSVDELNQFETYNWGYDPVQYNVPEGSYATDVLNPYSRIIEMKQMIAKLHEKGFRVTMDVVYNHMFDAGSSAFENIVPNYYFRLGENGEVSNGSWCGNDVDSLRPMCRKYIIDSTKMWVRDYGFDGFRFDLMGILDIETMNQLTEECQAIDASVMVYGEGWNMPTLMDDELKAMMFNNDKMPNIAHFNDRFGRGIKGSPFETELSDIGYGLGYTEELDRAMNVVAGSCTNIGMEPLFVEPTMTLNYVECHDNMTLFDKIMLSNKCESLETRLKRQKMITALILVSQGVAFLHAGQEFNRTKDGDHNSYMSPDSTNKLDWDRKDEYIETVEFVKGFIKLRKELKALRLNTAEEIKKHVFVRSLEKRVLEYTISDVAEYGPYEEIKIFINPTHTSIDVKLNDDYQLIANQNGLLAKATTINHLTVDAVELVVLAK
ncbi:type I pullulanase [Turicibacter sanguinis]|uniref:type I pullulanase n=1 Tax=Turicibacter sanguinis TaxID=154288 RepID=UPI0012BC3B02|nr:type I pullulanase [Turicibacter sanguinis]MDB8566191.1 type I pullulanase [Turicibacter sanguinis]MDB8568945.1 type I pullulanase [Turicibacter sanguinis]MDB8571692.1 type I pullulanase [Turicibacter sanguinis]MDB8580454.1 type I pullulanase [Turicibacter sanguinis]MTO10152.1 type I pullulanase [Turicibacter sanguinis]